MLPSMTSLSTSTTVPLDLRFIADALARPPFNMQHTVIALHDEMEHPELVALINDVLSHIDASNPISPHKIDLRNELPAVTAQRMSEFLINALKFDFALHTAATLSQKIVSGDDRTLMLQILYFLLKDIEAHKKAAYLDRFCGIMQIPVEFSVDESIQELLQQLKDRQDDFSQLVQRADQLQLSSKQTIDLKRDIHQMEEEKQQINGKIQQLQRKVQEIPNSSKWLQAARDLRQEQQKAQKLQQQTQELQSQLLAAQEKFETLEKSVQVTQGLPKFDPQALMIQLKEEVESKKNSVEVTLPE
ncbi:Intraflagellar transport protein 81, partial [Coelomomyces lativittatus]